MSTEGDKQYWDKKAPSYAQSPVADEAGYQRTLEKTRSLLKPTDTVLELGCGTGSTALKLADAVKSYLGSDISREMVKIAIEKQTAEEAKHPGLSFCAATAEELAAKPVRFTTILGFNYLHLVSDVAATLKATHSLLEDGGQLITKTPCLGDMNFLLRWGVPVVRLFGVGPTVTIFTETELSRLLRDADFEILEAEKHASKGDDSRPFIVARKK
ncbi:unnamed protein product [Clonostachys rhizophaga]|uniref:Uncharacterized protein n=1 Tax=Clonostachys rhizophaga TaxID=160324 RepID=A0A9N9VMS9_9HYPO|nr:unnamed protein product [Clonostachys rhizophaga]